jgi:hypothetical protein
MPESKHRSARGPRGHPAPRLLSLTTNLSATQLDNHHPRVVCLFFLGVVSSGHQRCASSPLGPWRTSCSSAPTTPRPPTSGKQRAMPTTTSEGLLRGMASAATCRVCAWQEPLCNSGNTKHPEDLPLDMIDVHHRDAQTSVVVPRKLKTCNFRSVACIFYTPHIVPRVTER